MVLPLEPLQRCGCGAHAHLPPAPARPHCCMHDCFAPPQASGLGRQGCTRTHGLQLHAHLLHACPRRRTADELAERQLAAGETAEVAVCGGQLLPSTSGPTRPGCCFAAAVSYHPGAGCSGLDTSTAASPGMSASALAQGRRGELEVHASCTAGAREAVRHEVQLSGSWDVMHGADSARASDLERWWQSVLISARGSGGSGSVSSSSGSGESSTRSGGGTSSGSNFSGSSTSSSSSEEGSGDGAAPLQVGSPAVQVCAAPGLRHAPLGLCMGHALCKLVLIIGTERMQGLARGLLRTCGAALLNAPR